MLAGHETLLHVTQLQVVHLQHVLLLLFLQGATDNTIIVTLEKRRFSKKLILFCE